MQKEIKRLMNKVAVVYGNGTIGGAVAKAFAREGATVFLAGRTKTKLTSIAKEISETGASLETGIVDATDEKAVESHMKEVIKKSGRVDISFNAIGLSQKNIQGNPLTELLLENFMRPISTYTQSHFLTAKAALKYMVKQGQGVILMQTPDASKVSQPFVGGIIPAWAAMEGLCRSISVEFAHHGIRAICLRTTAMPETPLIDEVFEIHGKVRGISFQDFQSFMEGMTHRKKLTTLEELTNAAVFAASNEGSALTGSVLNLTAGMTPE